MLFGQKAYLILRNMKKNKLAIITVAIMLLSPMIGFVAQSANLSNEPLSEDIYNVDKKEYYSTIQLAVDDADPGDTIEVSAGTYVEHIVIPIPLTLIGESKHYTYIMPPANVIAQDWLDDDDTIKIKSSWVNITGFNISNGDDNYASISAYDSSGPAVNNCSIKDNVFFNHYIGIFTFNSNNNIVNHNVFSSGGPCITLYSTNYTLVSNNEMYDNDLGIHVDPSCHNQIINNIISYNECGIEIRDQSFTNEISNNFISYNDRGIYIGGQSGDNEITDNVISNNGDGIYIEENSNENLIYHNLFIDNTVQALDNCSNYWDNGYPRGGNYWSDWLSPDTMSGPYQNIIGPDGFVDNPCLITGGTGQDNYPFADVQSLGPVHNIDSGEHFMDIQVAIDDDDTLEGHTIEVSTGTYHYGTLTVNKRLTLNGENPSTTIIDGTGHESSHINILSDFVTINGFTIVGNAGDGISFNMASNCLVTNNIISTDDGCGIDIFSGSFNTVKNNLIHSNYIGVFMLGSSNNNFISSNIITDSRIAGISMEFGSNYNVIQGNDVSNSWYGVATIGNVDDYSSYNQIYHNNFYNLLIGQSDCHINYWDDGYPSGGNYYSDYAGMDNYSGPGQDIPGSDGIGDEPCYVKSGNSGYQSGDGSALDNYPLMEPWVNPTVPDLSINDLDITLSNYEPLKWEEIYIEAKIHNWGNIDATATVSIYLDELELNSLIYREYEVSVPASDTATISADWLVNMTGEHSIIVEITDSNPGEIDVSNNLASKSLNVLITADTMKVMATTEKQRYVLGTDDHADVIFKITDKGTVVENATVTAWVLDPIGTNITISVTETSPGIHTGIFSFTNYTLAGTYRMEAIASKAGYVNGHNIGARDKFFLDSSMAQMPVLSEVSFSSDTPDSGEDVIISMAVQQHESVETIYACLNKHGDTQGTFVQPLYDDGTHSDAIAGDSIFTCLVKTGDMSETYYLDILINGITYENRGAMIVSPNDLVRMETFTDLQAIGGSVEVISPTTNTTIEISTISDISDISFTIVEHRGPGPNGGKSLEIIPSSNVAVAMTSAYIEISYTAEDIPDDIVEEDLRLFVYNVFTSQLEPCDPGGVNTASDLIWGDTEHFSDFMMTAISPILDSFDIELMEGWNLISIPLVQENESIEAVLASIDGLWNIAKYYDNSDATDPWKIYSSTGSPSHNDLTHLSHTMSIWLRTTSATTLTVYGTPADTTQIFLQAGWNMVGYPTLKDTVTVSSALWGTSADQVEIFDSSNPYLVKEVPADYILKPGEGLWVHVPADTVWNIP